MFLCSEKSNVAKSPNIISNFPALDYIELLTYSTINSIYTYTLLKYFYNILSESPIHIDIVHIATIKILLIVSEDDPGIGYPVRCMQRGKAACICCVLQGVSLQSCMHIAH